MSPADKTALRDAATVILLREPASADPSVLMGQRGAGAAFMPSKYVFPGGAVDPEDARVPLAGPVPEPCQSKLRLRPMTQAAPSPAALVGSAIREVWEETGLRLARPGQAPVPGPSPLGASWEQFLATGALPDPSGLRFVFRAITPPGRPRRFDARFLLADAAHLIDDPDDFSKASDELGHLHWVPLSQARALNLPFVTEVVLAQVAAYLPQLAPPRDVPFILNDDTSRIEML